MHATRVRLQERSNQNKFGISRGLRFIRRRMKMKWSLAIVVAALSGFALIGRTAEPEATVASQAAARAPEFKNLADSNGIRFFLLWG